MPRRARTGVLAVHLTVSAGWIGAVVAYVALGVAARTSAHDETVRAAWVSMDLVGRYVIVPLSLATLLTGLVLALGTPWGLFRHYWVSISFSLTLFATAVLLVHMPDVTASAEVARTATGARLDALGGDLFHAVGGLVVLLVVQVLNVYKPAGLTRYGWRRQRAERAERAVHRADRPG